MFSYIFIELNFRKNDTTVLYLLGMDLKNIKFLYFLKNIIIVIVGAFLSIVFSFTLLYIQKKYHLINLSSDIYILNSLPVSLNYQNFIIVIPFVITTSILGSFISLKSYIRNNVYVEIDELL